jgi:hypothetical protein
VLLWAIFQCMAAWIRISNSESNSNKYTRVLPELVSAPTQRIVHPNANKTT